MADNKTMYTDLFNAVTEAIEILKYAQIKAEKTYIETSDIDKDTISPFLSMGDFVDYEKLT